MTLKKYVINENGGEYIDMTPEEEAAFLAEQNNSIGFTKAQLIAYADKKLATASNAGTSVTVKDTANNTVTISTATDADGKSDILGLLMQAQMGVTSWTWYQSSGAITVNATALSQIAGAVAYHRGAVFTIWQSAIHNINDGTITTIEELDGLPWTTT